jgi:hypothetical protein
VCKFFGVKKRDEATSISESHFNCKVGNVLTACRGKVVPGRILGAIRWSTTVKEQRSRIVHLDSSSLFDSRISVMSHGIEEMHQAYEEKIGPFSSSLTSNQRKADVCDSCSTQILHTHRNGKRVRRNRYPVRKRETADRNNKM